MIDWSLILLGAAIGGVVVFLAELGIRRRSRRVRSGSPGTRSPPRSKPAGPEIPGVPAHRAVERPSAPQPSLDPGAGVPGPRHAESGRPSVGAAAPAIYTERVRISRRLLLHLAGLPRFGPSDVAPFGATQAGICASLNVDQSALAKVLRRLVAAGTLVEDRHHIAGGSRRLKAYRLSPLGEAVVRDMRSRARGPRPPVSREAPAPSMRR